jgi:hypothetical protein
MERVRSEHLPGLGRARAGPRNPGIPLSATDDDIIYHFRIFFIAMISCNNDMYDIMAMPVSINLVNASVG